MRKLSLSALLALLWLPLVSNAETGAAEKLEIDYLLRQIETSECVFNRNGSRHQGAEAVAHIQRKYDYYYDDIDNAEDFIRLSASKSTVTRRAYTIECPDLDTQTSQQWLLQKLHSYRTQAPRK